MQFESYAQYFVWNSASNFFSSFFFPNSILLSYKIRSTLDRFCLFFSRLLIQIKIFKSFCTFCKIKRSFSMARISFRYSVFPKLECKSVSLLEIVALESARSAPRDSSWKQKNALSDGATDGKVIRVRWEVTIVERKELIRTPNIYNPMLTL